MTTDADLVGLLRQIKELALSPYPFPDGDRLDFGLTIALGQVAGVAMKAVADYERQMEHQMKLFRAQLETHNFHFEAFGTSDDAAINALFAGLARHGEQHGIGPNWFKAEVDGEGNKHCFLEDIDVRAVPLGVTFRDGEAMAGE